MVAIRSLLLGGVVALAAGAAYSALALYLLVAALIQEIQADGAGSSDPATGAVLFLGPFVLLNSVPAARFGYSIVRSRSASARRGAMLLFGGWTAVLAVWVINASDHPSVPWLFVPLAVDVAVLGALGRGRPAAVSQ